ncbi:hypothetical protein XBI1_1870170 [Xenorhabdus bovienii str. Intermedium]|uniref:Uncharacterized protein n=1 Tax=Xenorhabdus bovienii str. Intermedium TaxID=1379677 RepID=A0A077QFP3_XENBV|nr:hypothetical protein XBI1_1870170 [Xenorhabdus bovienii str. Intermedium]
MMFTGENKISLFYLKLMLLNSDAVNLNLSFSTFSYLYNKLELLGCYFREL